MSCIWVTSIAVASHKVQQRLKICNNNFFFHYQVPSLWLPKKTWTFSEMWKVWFNNKMVIRFRRIDGIKNFSKNRTPEMYSSNLTSSQYQKPQHYLQLSIVILIHCLADKIFSDSFLLSSTYRSWGWHNYVKLPLNTAYTRNLNKKAIFLGKNNVYG